MATSYNRRINLYINGKEVRNDVASIRAEFNKLTNSLAHTTRGTDEYNRKAAELARIKKMLDEHSQAVKGVQGIWGRLNETFRGLLPAIGLSFGVGEVVSFTKELVKLGGEAQGITAAFKRIADEDFLQKLREATHYTVSDLELMRNSIKASNFQIPLESLANLFEFAAARAQQTGENVKFLVDSIILGIGRKSPLILDNLGISAVMLRDRLKGVSAEAADIGQVASVVGEIAKEELQKMGGYIENTGTRVTQLSTTWQNFKKLLSQSDTVMNTVGGSLGFIQTLLSQIDYFMTNITQMKKFNLWDMFLGPAGGVQIFKDIVDWKEFEKLKNVQKEAAAVVKSYNEMYEAARNPRPIKSEGADNAKGQSLIEIQKGLLEIAKAMPEATEAEITAKNKKIQVIELEIKRLQELGRVQADVAKQSKLKSAEDALNSAYAEESNLLKEQMLDRKRTQEWYNNEMYALELSHLVAVRELYRQYGESTVEMDGKVIDKKLAWQGKMDDMLKVSHEVDKSLAEDERNLFADLSAEFESYLSSNSQAQKDQTRDQIVAELEKQEAIQTTRDLQLKTSFDAGVAAVESANTMKEAGKAVLNSIREQIRARIAEAVSIQIVKALGKIPFPFNLIVATAAGGAVGLLFNKLIPEFEEGGYTIPGKSDQPAGVVHSGEWVAPAWMVNDPVTGEVIGGLEQARKSGIKPETEAPEAAGIVHRGEWVAPAWMVSDPVTGQVIRELEATRKAGTTPEAQPVTAKEDIPLPGKPEVLPRAQSFIYPQRMIINPEIVRIVYELETSSKSVDSFPQFQRINIPDYTEVARRTNITPNKDLVRGKIPMRTKRRSGQFETGGYVTGSTPGNGKGENGDLSKVLERVAKALSDNTEATSKLMGWKPKVYTELIKKDLDILENINRNSKM